MTPRIATIRTRKDNSRNNNLQLNSTPKIAIPRTRKDNSRNYNLQLSSTPKIASTRTKKDNPRNYNLQLSSSNISSKPSKIIHSINMNDKITQNDYDNDESSYNWSSGADKELFRILPDNITILDNVSRKVMKVDILSTCHIKIEKITIFKRKTHLKDELQQRQ